ncbi:MAG: hypothetical protein O2U61_06820 [Candidatus Bathyarchaeota archaeon]|nr:hypothetical protein [Candidatus Bathyarchaeota archaeon]
MYISASFIDVKKHQDYADFSNVPEYQTLVLCDGIGEFEMSRDISEFTVHQILKKSYKTLKELILDGELEIKKKSGLIAGTTVIQAYIPKNSNKVKIEYLGNGGIIHLPGDFGSLPNSTYPYRYNEVMLPHIAPNGALTRHISHHSSKQELAPGEFEIKMNHPAGDILLFFTDGISALEDKVILKDDMGRFWRNEPETIQLILQELNSFLKHTRDLLHFQDRLVDFNNSVLKKLKESNMLEDDASLGIIVSEDVLNNLMVLEND